MEIVLEGKSSIKLLLLGNVSKEKKGIERLVLWGPRRWKREVARLALHAVVGMALAIATLLVV